MISKNIFTDIILMIILIFLQVFVMNKIMIDGKYSAVIYPIFVLFYPFNRNKYVFLLLSFFIGLGIDIIVGTWGINAFATTMIAYFRTQLFRSSAEGNDSFSFKTMRWLQFLFFILISLFIHQLIVQYVEFFKLSRIFLVFVNVVYTTIISFVFIVLYSLVFHIKQRV